MYKDVAGKNGGKRPLQRNKRRGKMYRPVSNTAGDIFMTLCVYVIYERVVGAAYWTVSRPKPYAKELHPGMRTCVRVFTYKSE